MSEKTLTIVGSVLAGLLVMVGFKTIIDLNSGHQGETTTAGYELPDPAAEEKPVEAAAAGAGEAAPAAPKGGAEAVAAVVAMVGSADAGKGKKLFRRCAACHSIKAGDPPALGPNLHGVVGRDIGSQEAFSGYSEALKVKEGNWTLEELAAFLKNPKQAVPGTRMIFGGIKKDSELADLLAYLQAQSN